MDLSVKLLKNVETEYVIMLDDDDYLMPHSFRCLLDGVGHNDHLYAFIVPSQIDYKNVRGFADYDKKVYDPERYIDCVSRGKTRFVMFAGHCRS